MSPSLDPAALGSVEPRDKTRQSAVAALTIARQQAEAACNGARAIHADASLLAPEKHRRAHDVSTAALLPSMEPLEKARRANERELTELRVKLAGPSIELSDIRGVEIRSRIEGLKPSDRIAAIFRAIGRGDDSIAAAVLGNDRLLTGFMTDREVEQVRDCWAKARYPGEVGRLAVLEADHAHIERTGEFLRLYQTQCAGPSIVAPVLAAPGPGHRPTVYGY